jgi:hypothetical protein
MFMKFNGRKGHVTFKNTGQVSSGAMAVEATVEATHDKWMDRWLLFGLSNEIVNKIEKYMEFVRQITLKLLCCYWTDKLIKTKRFRRRNLNMPLLRAQGATYRFFCPHAASDSELVRSIPVPGIPVRYPTSEVRQSQVGQLLTGLFSVNM